MKNYRRCTVTPALWLMAASEVRRESLRTFVRTSADGNKTGDSR